MVGTCLLIAFFVLAKFSFTRLRRCNIDEIELDEGAKAFLKKLFDNPHLFISSVQFYVVMLFLLLGILLQSLVEAFSPYLNLATPLVYALVLILTAFVVLIFAELLPKALALSFPEFTFRLTRRFIRLMLFLVRPLAKLTLVITKFFLKKTEVPVMSEIDLIHSEEEIRSLVNHSHLSGAIDKVESELIDNVFDFVDRIAKEVMIPRQDVECLYTDATYEENRNIIIASKHTRYPLCDGDKDHIIGLIHVKDFLEHEKEAKTNIKNIKRKILIVPEVMKLSVLLQNMRSQRIYQSIVVDEYGGMVGLVGLEDIVEELVGDIKDEHEESKEQIIDLGNGVFDFDGTTLVGDVEYELKINLVDCEEDTIAGYIFGLLGQSPEIGERVTVNNYEFIITEMQGYRITRVEARPLTEELKTDEQES